jgi:hypothetical protein
MNTWPWRREFKGEKCPRIRESEKLETFLSVSYEFFFIKERQFYLRGTTIYSVFLEGLHKP